MEQKQTPPVTEATDRYLDYSKHSQEAYEHANHVLGAFEFAVQLATQRALEQLEIPEAVVIPFPRRGTFLPDGAA